MYLDALEKCGVPVVLDCIGRASVKQLRDCGPLVTKTVVGLNDDPVLLRRPVGFPDLGG